MLIIRKEQMDIFKSAAFKRFEDDMIEHIKEFFPNHFRIAGEPTIRKVVQYGIERSNTYGFVTERNMCLYITVMTILGSNFDKDFFFPWAPEILKEENKLNPSDRADKLADTALDFMKKIAGQNNADMNRAFLKLRKEHPKIITRRPSDDFTVYTKDFLRNLFQKKYMTLGEAIIDRLIRHGIKTTADYNITNQNGQLLLIVLMFFMGTACDREPFLPWLSKVLNDPTPQDQNEKVKRFYQESVNYLEKWLTKPPLEGLDNV